MSFCTCARKINVGYRPRFVSMENILDGRITYLCSMPRYASTTNLMEVVLMQLEHNILLLLLAAPTYWLWGRCGRHNSPAASSVMDIVFRRSDCSHVSVDTVHPSLLRSSPLSSPGWYHLQSLSSDIVFFCLASLRGQTT